MIGTELLDDPRADAVLVGRQLRDIARLNALFGGTRAVVRELVPLFRAAARDAGCGMRDARWTLLDVGSGSGDIARAAVAAAHRQDRKSTRLNSSHQIISYAVFCLKKKKKNNY